MLIFSIILLVLLAFITAVYLIKINDDIRIYENRIQILECEMKDLKQFKASMLAPSDASDDCTEEEQPKVRTEDIIVPDHEAQHKF